MSYEVIVADPPWAPRDALGKRGAKANYSVMTTPELCAMNLPPIAKDAWLFMWRLSSMQEDALAVVAAWGFTVKSELVWCKLTTTGKRHFGMGHYVRASHETCLICTRGKVRPISRSVRSVFEAPTPMNKSGRTLHSAKPDAFFWLVEQLTGDASKIEMFSRMNRSGWDAMGNETGKFTKS